MSCKSRHTCSCFKNENMPLITVTTFLLKLKSRHVFNQRWTCYEVHAVLVKCLWKHCFVKIAILWLIYHHDIQSRKVKLFFSSSNEVHPSVNLSIIDMIIMRICQIRVITKLPNSEQSYKGKVKTPNLPLSLRFKGSGCHYNSI